MIDLYTWKTSNCQKVNIAICELGLPFVVHAIDISSGAQKSADYLAINPNGKVPAIHDRDTGVTIFESGAILLYLAEKTGKLLPPDPVGRWAAIQWTMWQMSAIGPTGGQLNHFRSDPARGSYALDRFTKEYNRLLDVLEGALGAKDYLAGSYSIADIAVWPWITRFEKMGIDLSARPSLVRWYKAIADRPGSQTGFALLNPDTTIPMP